LSYFFYARSVNNGRGVVKKPSKLNQKIIAELEAFGVVGGNRKD
jgi:hypothetical protein